MTTLPEQKFLLDVNVLIALTEESHQHHRIVTKWFANPRLDWGICALSEAGLLRLSMNPAVGNLELYQATALLNVLQRSPGYRYWPITAGWTELAAPLSERIFGHLQITDAFLLGLAIHANGILVTLDKAILAMAGPRYRGHVLLIES
jgi:uncharacterized protein